MKNQNKKLNRRDFLRLSAVGAAGAALAACQSAPTAAPTAEPVAADTEPTAAPAMQEEGTLVWFALHAADHLPPFQQQKSMFAAMYPKVKIEEVFVPWGEFTTKLPVMLAAGEQVDVCWHQTQVGISLQSVDYWVRKDQLVDLTPYFDSDAMPRSDFFEGILKISEFGGKLYGIPFEIPMFIFWYNKTLLEAAGVGIPDATWTWEKHHEAAQAATKKDGDRVTQYGSAGIQWAIAAAQAGAKMVSEDGEKLNLDTPEFRAGVNEWYYYIENRLAPVGEEWNTFAGIQSGNMAINMTGTWMWNTHRQVAPELGFDFGASVVPAGPGPQPISWATMGGTNAWTVLKASKTPELAAKFAIHLGYGPGAEPWAATGRISPVKRFTKDYYQKVGGFNEVESAQYGTMLDAAFAHMDAGAMAPWAPAFSYKEKSWGDVAAIVDEELNKVAIDKSQTIDEALGNAFKRLDQMLAEA